MSASVVALSTIGLLATPSVSDAQPPCEQWGFAGESRIVEPDTGWKVIFFSDGTEANGVGTASNNRGESKTGQMSGGMDGGRFDVVVDYDNGQRQYYRGGVHGDDGVATGVTSNGITNESGKQFTSRLTCITPG
jgi:hypothetical protein